MRETILQLERGLKDNARSMINKEKLLYNEYQNKIQSLIIEAHQQDILVRDRVLAILHGIQSEEFYNNNKDQEPIRKS